MPIYHLHIRTGGQLIRDEEGYRCSDLETATLEAVKGARSLMSADIADGFLDLDQAIELYDPAGRHLETVTFEDAVTIRLGPQAAVKASMV